MMTTDEEAMAGDAMEATVGDSGAGMPAGVREHGDGTVSITIRIPEELRARVDRKRRPDFATRSEYVRDLIRRDLEGEAATA